ncbi:3-deoxy-7-phosphoheptulonate synthase [Streptococcus chenjunshii]|uniref:Phospho-2-dehydro-3-deoxyheptonate aldolase n=1 Tax=Streptococcus chenjunshii TaxID=2173853 RepID=A0A372KMX5_9STRE|nr:3-deoxy-7-phosphoheptulonate synthase [Streptococcus chenjunshii]AXQ78049.1 3-deoxy-7-phosphoheptulonate synthase [Streptococcus chenjunshii]RFU51144.1 3-deoxy-7-phosphoheptulonate synthase [Streptococcus chenjunshii]RFU53316.1 3-deoxy-7-phosphoheptulonate synthase [Streptococcus chenjunshii]
MGIHQKSAALSVAQIKTLSKLEGRFLDNKLARDRELAAIIKGEDRRLLLVVGPCSSDNESAVLDYAQRLAKLQDEVKDKLFIVMRVYTSKPRTNGDGYKGMIHQPDAEAAPRLMDGIAAVRRLHYRVIAETGLTTADEMLYPANLSFLDDLVSYHAIGARSVEDQEHRFVASGLDAPTGMKNPTSGNLTVMFNAIYAAQNQQNFIFHDAEVETDGNSLAHAILRGAVTAEGESRPNYAYEDLLKAINQYEKMGLKNPFLMIDTNHDNSGKDYLEQIRIVRQTLVNRDWNEKIKHYVRGFMIESYLEDGRQDKPEKYGQSITDPCLGWEKTEKLIREIYRFLDIDSYEDLIFTS